MLSLFLPSPGRATKGPPTSCEGGAFAPPRGAPGAGGELPRARLSAAACSPDGSLLAYAERTGDVQIVDCASGRQVQTIKVASGNPAALAFLPDGRTLVSAHGPDVQLCDAPTGQVFQRQRMGASLMGMALSPNGKALALRSRRALSLWVVTSEKPTEAFDVPPPELSRRPGAPPRRPSTAEGRTELEGVPLARDAAPREPPLQLPPLPADTVDASPPAVRWERYAEASFRFAAVDVSIDGWFALGRGPRSIYLLDLASGKVRSTFTTDNSAYRVMFAQGGKTMLCRVGHALASVNPATGELLASRDFDQEAEAYFQFVTLPEGDVVLLANPKGAQLAKLPGLEVIRDLQFDEDRETGSLVISRHGSLAAVGTHIAGRSGVMQVFDTAKGELRCELPYRRARYFSSDGRLVAGERPMLVDLTTKEETPLISQGLRPVRYWIDPARSHLLDGDSRSGKIDIWDLASGTQLATISTGEHFVHEVCFFPDGKGFVTKSGFGLQFWAAKKAE